MIGVVAVAVTVAIALVCRMASPSVPPPGRTTIASLQRVRASTATAASSRPRPHVPFRSTSSVGFVPYWEMNGDIADHLERDALTTLALFSVTNTRPARSTRA